MTKHITAPMAAVGGAAVKFASESQGAFQQFAASTGAAADEMQGYQESITEVYKSNFGESMMDVADGMAKVKQNMSEISGAQLKEVTEDAFALRDVFGVEIAESTRSADALMKNFGVTAEGAFNLMAQGAQSGLDFSGELFDNINEYSVQFKKLGMDADDMFAVFANGADNGAFNLDKIGDAVKEFSIRAIDGSETTAAGFAAMGMNADTMAARFAAGGDTAKTAFDEVIQGLAGMKDPVAQNAAGVQLFGTMWEDLGPQVVTSLSTVNGAIDSTKNSMDQLNATKYDTLTAALGGLWRTIQTDVLQPIGSMLIPYVEMGIEKVGEFTEWWNALGEGTQNAIIKFGLISAAVGPVLMGIGKLTIGTGNFINSLGKIGGAVMKFKNTGDLMGTLTKGITSGFGKAAAPIKMLGKLFMALPSPLRTALPIITGAALLIYKNWDKVKDVFNRVKKSVGNFISSAKTKLSEGWEHIKAFGDKVRNVFSKAVEAGMEMARAAIENKIESVKMIFGGFKEVLDGIVKFLQGDFQGGFETVFGGLAKIVEGAMSGLPAIVKAPINAIIGLVNRAIEGINSLSISIPEGVPLAGGMHLGFNLPKLPQLYRGTDNWRGGPVQINERGGEIVDLPKGSRVYPHDESVRIARQESLSKKVSVTIAKLADQIIVREEADIDRIAEALARKLEETELNMV